ncbi:hypothetical protein NSQ62_07880 [Solibacillus sp. FSL H8-0523]|uniref:hypothetical protein n=1 Tax=Solibacillus sp. FSL H8-0523 TaxID=2954511 RepID=UPI003101993A
MLHIRKIKTMYGLRYAVVDLFPYYKTVVNKLNKKVEYVKAAEYHSIEYQENGKIKVAIFELSAEGLERAKEVQSAFRKGKSFV